MKISEIILESTRTNKHQDDSQVIDLLNSLEQTIDKISVQIQRKAPNATVDDDINASEFQAKLDEGLGSTLGKILAVGAIGLGSLSASANQQVGQELAKCAGLMLASSTFMSNTIGPQAAAANVNTAKTAMELAARFMPENTVKSISMDTMMKSSGMSGTEVVANLQKCNNLIKQATDMAETTKTQVDPQLQRWGDNLNKKYTERIAVAMGYLDVMSKYDKIPPEIAAAAKNLVQKSGEVIKANGELVQRGVDVAQDSISKAERRGLLKQLPGSVNLQVQDMQFTIDQLTQINKAISANDRQTAEKLARELDY